MCFIKCKCILITTTCCFTKFILLCKFFETGPSTNTWLVRSENISISHFFRYQKNLLLICGEIATYYCSMVLRIFIRKGFHSRNICRHRHLSVTWEQWQVAVWQTNNRLAPQKSTNCDQRYNLKLQQNSPNPISLHKFSFPHTKKLADSWSRLWTYH